MCKLIFPLLAVSLMTGCATMDSAYQGSVSVANPDAMEMQTEVRWIGHQPRVRPVSAGDKVVYVASRSSSGVDVELKSSVEHQFKQRGYRITGYIEEAQFIVDADLRHFGEHRETRNAGAATGAVIGAAAGGITGNNVDKFDRTTGAVAGAILGGALGHILDNRNKIVKVDLIVDVTIGERIADGVKTNRSSSSSAGTDQREPYTSEGYGESGHHESSSSEDQSVTVDNDFLYHNNQVVASARKMDLTLAEAQPALTDRLSRAIASALP
jgi:uncharacterized lipoprotein YajG